MNNRYLFRAKRIDNGEWIVGDLSHHKTGKVFVKPLNGSAISTCEVDKDTVCQCTGLKDKNGKLIWENDILNSGNLVVKWREELASYCLTKKGWMYQHFFGEAVDACDCEVIGNIFDNPEPLEVGE